MLIAELVFTGYTKWQVSCGGCRRGTAQSDTKALAYEAWNKRAFTQATGAGLPDTPTPMTNAVAQISLGGTLCAPGTDIVSGEFCRQLERELSEMRVHKEAAQGAHLICNEDRQRIQESLDAQFDRANEWREQAEKQRQRADNLQRENDELRKRIADSGAK